jgi:hypothetical protein
MDSSVLPERAAEPGHVSASGSRDIIHRQSGVVAVARPRQDIVLRAVLGLHQNRRRSCESLDWRVLLAAHSARR